MMAVMSIIYNLASDKRLTRAAGRFKLRNGESLMASLSFIVHNNPSCDKPITGTRFVVTCNVPVIALKVYLCWH